MTNIIESKDPRTPPMAEFNVSNHLLGDRAALQEAWDRDGYWFFRGVLDLDAIAQTRAVYLEELANLGVVQPGNNELAIYNGAPLDNYPIKMGGPRELDQGIPGPGARAALSLAGSALSDVAGGTIPCRNVLSAARSTWCRKTDLRNRLR